MLAVYADGNDLIGLSRYWLREVMCRTWRYESNYSRHAYISTLIHLLDRYTFIRRMLAVYADGNDLIGLSRYMVPGVMCRIRRYESNYSRHAYILTMIYVNTPTRPVRLHQKHACSVR